MPHRVPWRTTSMPEQAQLRQSGKEESARRLSLIVIGASAGGLHSIIEVVRRLEPDLPISILVAQHLDPNHASALPELLSHRTSMKVREVVDGDAISRGSIYTAAPGRHVVVQGKILTLSDAEPIRHQRPSIDLLFG